MIVKVLDIRDRAKQIYVRMADGAHGLTQQIWVRVINCRCHFRARHIGQLPAFPKQLVALFGAEAATGKTVLGDIFRLLHHSLLEARKVQATQGKDYRGIGIHARRQPVGHGTHVLAHVLGVRAGA